MNNLFIKNGIYENYNQWKVDTVALENLQPNNCINLPNFFLIVGSKKINCNLSVYCRLGRAREFFYDICINYTDYNNSTSMGILSVIYLYNQSNQCLLHGSSEVHNTSYLDLLSRLKVSELKKFKLEHGDIFLKLYSAGLSTFCPTLSLDYFNCTEIECNYDYCCEVTKNFGKCFIEDELFPDGIIISKNKEFKIHKNIFSARSSYFSASFKHETIEKQNNFVPIKNKNGDLYEDAVVQELVRYIYTGAVKNLQQVSLELFELAHMYSMSSLQKMCTEYLLNNINVQNMTHLIRVSRVYDVKEFKNEISSFIHRQQTFMIESRYLISENLWKNEPHEIESGVFKTKDRMEYIHEFKFKLKKISNDYFLLMDYLGSNLSKFFCTLTFGLCNSNGVSIDHHHYLNVSPSTLEKLFPHKIFEHNELEHLVYKYDKLFLNMFIGDQSAIEENSLNFNNESFLKKHTMLHECEVLRDLSSLHNNQAFSDFKIKTKDKEFYVHKNILAANSSKFYSSLKDVNQKYENDCLFIDIESEVVEIMLQYIYMGSTEKFSEFGFELYNLAEEYGFQKLRQDSILYLNSNPLI